VARYIEKPAPRGAERRTSPRVELELEVTLESDSNFYTGLTQDISSGGIFVSTHQLRRIGEHVMVKFKLPGSATPIAVESEVRWLREAGPIHDHRSVDYPPGMGLRFLTLSSESRLAIAAFLKARDSIFYDDE
jgi:uncharacterized protein (TIGR02266 family)